MFTIGLHRPKHSVNVGSVMRAAGCFGASAVIATGRRCNPGATDTMCAHRRIPLIWVDDLPSAVPFGVTPVLVEVDASTTLRQFNHPKRAMYIFGPEDSSLPKEMIDGAPRVRIPTRGCLNLAATVNIVLYDRCAKAERDAARSAA